MLHMLSYNCCSLGTVLALELLDCVGPDQMVREMLLLDPTNRTHLLIHRPRRERMDGIKLVLYILGK